MFVEHNVYVFNTRMRLNSTGVTDGHLAMPMIENSRVRASTEEVFSINGILESTLDRVARHGIEFLV